MAIAPVIIELLEDAEQLLRPSTLTAAEGLDILMRMRSLTETTLRCVDPTSGWAPAMRCFSGWPRQLTGSDTAAPGSSQPEPGERSGA